jgi:nitrogenase molybdenum-iron protein NifN
MKSPVKTNETYTSTRNACKLCSPLGACLVFKGIKGCLPLIHGSQGCATYIRRYMISHYKEPVDIASSNFSEESTIFGGNRNFNTGIDNIIKQYNPEVIGIASTCLSETIGENIPGLIQGYRSANNLTKLPDFIHASTPSYQGTHIDGFHEAVTATIKYFANDVEKTNHINIFPGFVSPEDIRHLKEILDDFSLQYVLFPDYSDTLDNPNWNEYQLIPEGVTTTEELRKTGSAKASIEFGYVLGNGALKGRLKNTSNMQTISEWLFKTFEVPIVSLGLPIGIKETDKFMMTLQNITGKATPRHINRERGRLIDAYVDGHKYLFGKRAIVYGEEDLVIGLISFLEEIGIETVLAASGGESGIFNDAINHVTGDKRKDIPVLSGADFEKMNDMADALKPDIIIGNSKGYYIARRLGIPHVRVGFPVHDRFGAQRIQHLCYKGTQQLFDRITNALIEYKQEHSPVGYKYI